MISTCLLSVAFRYSPDGGKKTFKHRLGNPSNTRTHPLSRFLPRNVRPFINHLLLIESNCQPRSDPDSAFWVISESGSNICQDGSGTQLSKLEETVSRTGRDSLRNLGMRSYANWAFSRTTPLEN